MLQDESAPKYAQILTGLDGTCSVTNCDFFGGEGPALHWEWGALRGRTMDRALEITQADGIIIADIDFFAANFIAHEGSK